MTTHALDSNSEFLPVITSLNHEGILVGVRELKPLPVMLYWRSHTPQNGTKMIVRGLLFVPQPNIVLTSHFSKRLALSLIGNAYLGNRRISIVVTDLAYWTDHNEFYKFDVTICKKRPIKISYLQFVDIVEGAIRASFKEVR